MWIKTIEQAKAFLNSQSLDDRKKHYFEMHDECTDEHNELCWKILCEKRGYTK